jgi:hypothetical protein
MDLKKKIRQVLREQYGDFKTHLEHIYEKKVTQQLISKNPKERDAWATYNQVVLELKNSIKDNLRVKELQYKLTDNMDPNQVCIDVIKEVEQFSPELERLYYKIRNFA